MNTAPKVRKVNGYRGRKTNGWAPHGAGARAQCCPGTQQGAPAQQWGFGSTQHCLAA